MKVNVKLLKNKKENSVVAYATAEIVEGVEVNDIRIYQKDGDLFVFMPSRAYEDPEGKTKYSNIVYITDEDLYDEVVGAVITAYKKAQKVKR